MIYFIAILAVAAILLLFELYSDRIERIVQKRREIAIQRWMQQGLSQDEAEDIVP